MCVVVRRTAMTLICVLGWVTATWLVLVRDVGAAGLFSVAGISAAVLFVVVPLVTFVPLASRWEAPFYDLEAAGGWGLFALVATFVTPPPAPSTWTILLFLAPLTVACATLLTAVAFVSAARFCPPHARPAFVDARRRGYLAATMVIALGMLAGLGVLSSPIAFLLLTTCILVEALVSARGRDVLRKGTTARVSRDEIRSAPGS